jgi:hypothetical protein
VTRQLKYLAPTTSWCAWSGLGLGVRIGPIPYIPGDLCASARRCSHLPTSPRKRVFTRVGPAGAPVVLIAHRPVTGGAGFTFGMWAAMLRRPCPAMLPSSD